MVIHSSFFSRFICYYNLNYLNKKIKCALFGVVFNLFLPIWSIPPLTISQELCFKPVPNWRKARLLTVNVAFKSLRSQTVFTLLKYKLINKKKKLIDFIMSFILSFYTSTVNFVSELYLIPYVLHHSKAEFLLIAGHQFFSLLFENTTTQGLIDNISRIYLSNYSLGTAFLFFKQLMLTSQAAEYFDITLINFMKSLPIPPNLTKVNEVIIEVISKMGEEKIRLLLDTLRSLRDDVGINGNDNVVSKEDLAKEVEKKIPTSPETVKSILKYGILGCGAILACAGLVGLSIFFQTTPDLATAIEV